VLMLTHLSAADDTSGELVVTLSSLCSGFLSNLFQDLLYLAEKLFQLGTRSSQFSLYAHSNRKCASYKISVRVSNVNHTDV
jgi:hypothetical protein